MHIFFATLLLLVTAALPARAAGLPLEVELLATGLNPVQLEALGKFLDGDLCPCGCGKGTLANCIETDKACGVSRRFARQAIDELRAGKEIVVARQAVANYKKGKAAPAPRAKADPDKVYDIQVGSSPVIGPSNAEVTAIAFLDYQ